MFSAKWLEILHAVLNLCIAALDLEAIVQQYMPDRDGRAALLHIFVAVDT